jgi:hypothetical protein
MVRMVGGTTRDRGLRRLIVTLVVLVLLLVILKMAAFSGASFSFLSANPANTFTAGELTITNDRAGTYVVDVVALRPGASQSGDLRLTGDDDFAAGLTLASAGLSVTPSGSTIGTILRLRVEDVTSGTPAAPPLYEGSLAGLGTVPLPPPLPAGQPRALRFTVTFPLAAAGPALQGNSAELTVSITGVSQ